MQGRGRLQKRSNKSSLARPLCAPAHAHAGTSSATVMDPKASQEHHHPDRKREAALLERLAALALLISLFAVGLRLGVPLRD